MEQNKHITLKNQNLSLKEVKSKHQRDIFKPNGQIQTTLATTLNPIGISITSTKQSESCDSLCS